MMHIPCVVLVLLCLAPARAFEDKTVFQYLVDNGYTTLTNLMKSAGVDVRLDGSGPFTVFAPSDAVLSGVDPKFLASLTPLQIKRMINYHVVYGFQLLSQLRKATDISSEEGHDINITTTGGSARLNGIATIVSPNDIICTNGVIQPINNVLIPPLFNSSNVAGILVTRDDLFRNTFLYLYFANLTRVLEGGEFTVFAPVDAAWAPYVQEILHPRNISEAIAYYQWTEMMKYHIVPGVRTSDMLKNGEQLFTLHGYPLNVTVTGSDMMVNNARLLQKDIMASNGVIHAVSQVMYPYDLYLEYLKAMGQTTPMP